MLESMYHLIDPFVQVVLSFGRVALMYAWFMLGWMLLDMFLFNVAIKKIIKNKTNWEKIVKDADRLGLGSGYKLWWENLDKKS